MPEDSSCVAEVTLRGPTSAFRFVLKTIVDFERWFFSGSRARPNAEMLWTKKKRMNHESCESWMGNYWRLGETLKAHVFNTDGHENWNKDGTKRLYNDYWKTKNDTPMQVWKYDRILYYVEKVSCKIFIKNRNICLQHWNRNKTRQRYSHSLRSTGVMNASGSIGQSCASRSGTEICHTTRSRFICARKSNSSIPGPWAACSPMISSREVGSFIFDAALISSLLKPVNSHIRSIEMCPVRIQAFATKGFGKRCQFSMLISTLLLKQVDFLSWPVQPTSTLSQCAMCQAWQMAQTSTRKYLQYNYSTTQILM